MSVPLREVPIGPSIFAMYGGEPGSRFVAYVGQARKLRERLTQHLVRRDSSVTTEASSSASTLTSCKRRAPWRAHRRTREREA